MIDINIDQIIEEYTNEIKEYRELKEMYNELIKRLAIFLNNLEINNPIMLYEIYCIMYKNGMLSIKDYKPQTNYLDINGLYGIDILNGQSVCRHIASLLNDIATEYGYETRLLAIYYKMYKNNNNNYKFIKRKFKTRIVPNHVVNQIATNEKNYILDPTNQLILKKGNGNNIVQISGKKVKMIHNEKIQQVINWGLIRENNQKDIIMDQKMSLPTVTIEEIEENNNKINKLFAAFQDTMKLLDFRNNNLDFMKDITLLAKTVKEKQEKTKIKTLK